MKSVAALAIALARGLAPGARAASAKIAVVAAENFYGVMRAAFFSMA
jgi:hypothetical protein